MWPGVYEVRIGKRGLVRRVLRRAALAVGHAAAGIDAPPAARACWLQLVSGNAQLYVAMVGVECWFSPWLVLGGREGGGARAELEREIAELRAENHALKQQPRL